MEVEVQVQVDKVPAYPTRPPGCQGARVPVERCEVRQVKGEGEGGATTVRLGQLGRALVPWGGEVR